MTGIRVCSRSGRASFQGCDAGNPARCRYGLFPLDEPPRGKALQSPRGRQLCVPQTAKAIPVQFDSMQVIPSFATSSFHDRLSPRTLSISRHARSRLPVENWSIACSGASHCSPRRSLSYFGLQALHGSRICNLVISKQVLDTCTFIRIGLPDRSAPFMDHRISVIG